MDAELEAIRARRMADLQSQQGTSIGSAGNSIGPAGVGQGDSEEQAQQRAAAAEEQRRTIMSQILSSEARERLSRIALVRPERARGIEDLLVRMAQSGQLRGRVSEEQLIGVLDQIEAGEKKQRGGADSGAGKIIFNRRKGLDDSDDDF
ncbi:hypothetical protein OIO90_004891 [Microbotryomycetes sp. JL221]|nr:hypothetical protein OIO90_004891 [Microbotryomycetes sp. JL221]